MSLHILVAGGCHVAGYPIGSDYSFVNVITDRLDDLGIGAEASTLAYLPAKHVPRLVEAIRSRRPDVTVLQLGNYETTVTFRQYFRRKLRMKKAKASSGREHLPPNATFQGTRLWRMKCSTKLFFDTLLGHDLLDLPALEASFTEMFDAIAREDSGQVIVLSPLPCADPLYMRYRFRLMELMYKLARSRGFVFVHSPLGIGNQPQYFADPTHLNALGQESVGDSVARVISQMCRKTSNEVALAHASHVVF